MHETNKTTPCTTSVLCSLSSIFATPYGVQSPILTSAHSDPGIVSYQCDGDCMDQTLCCADFVHAYTHQRSSHRRWNSGEDIETVPRTATRSPAYNLPTDSVYLATNKSQVSQQ